MKYSKFSRESPFVTSACGSIPRLFSRENTIIQIITGAPNRNEIKNDLLHLRTHNMTWLSSTSFTLTHVREKFTKKLRFEVHCRLLVYWLGVDDVDNACVKWNDVMRVLLWDFRFVAEPIRRMMAVFQFYFKSKPCNDFSNIPRSNPPWLVHNTGSRSIMGNWNLEDPTHTPQFRLNQWHAWILGNAFYLKQIQETRALN